jgi:homoserine kinase
MAVDIWNEITVERSSVFSVEVTGIDCEFISCEVDPLTGDSKHLLLKTLRRAFEFCGEIPMPPLKVSCVNNIPISSGFGSSSAVIIGGLIAGLVLCGKELSVGQDFPSGERINEELLQLANDIEGHPDNGIKCDVLRLYRLNNCYFLWECFQWHLLFTEEFNCATKSKRVRRQS